jgi:hypothetical protein
MKQTSIKKQKRGRVAAPLPQLFSRPVSKTEILNCAVPDVIARRLAAPALFSEVHSAS